MSVSDQLLKPGDFRCSRINMNPISHFKLDVFSNYSVLLHVCRLRLTKPEKVVNKILDGTMAKSAPCFFRRLGLWGRSSLTTTSKKTSQPPYFISIFLSFPQPSTPLLPIGSRSSQVISSPDRSKLGHAVRTAAGSRGRDARAPLADAGGGSPAGVPRGALGPRGRKDSHPAGCPPHYRLQGVPVSIF